MSEQGKKTSVWRNPHFAAGPAAETAACALERGRQLRDRLASGYALGTFLIELPTVGAISAIALAGFDFVVIDMEHSSIDFARLESLIAASHAVGLVALVRPWSSDPGLIGKILDCGAHGIMAPHVDSAQRARSVVDQARFAPHGRRGFSPLAKFDGLASPLEALSNATIVVVQIEGREALTHVRDIASVEGLDAIFIGPYDLSLSLQVPPGSPAVFAAAEEIGRSVPRGVHPGIYLDDPAQSGEWAARGFALQCVSFDGRMLVTAAKDVVARARRSAEERNP